MQLFTPALLVIICAAGTFCQKITFDNTDVGGIKVGRFYIDGTIGGNVTELLRQNWHEYILIEVKKINESTFSTIGAFVLSGATCYPYPVHTCQCFYNTTADNVHFVVNGTAGPDLYQAIIRAQWQHQDATNVYSNKNYTVPGPNVSPVVTLSCSDTTVQEGQRVSCTCTETANKFILATTTLFYGTVNVSSALQHVTAPITVNRYTSEIICQAQVPEGIKTNKTQALNVYFAPTIFSFDVNSSSGQIVVERNSTVRFSCQAEGNPSPSLSLRKNGTELQHFRDPTRNFNLTLTYTMTVSKCLDAGVYTCHAGEGETTTNKTVTVFVKCRQQFTNPDSLRQIFKGRVDGRVSMNVSVFGCPEPTMTLHGRNYTLSVDAYSLTYIKQQPPYGIVSLMINIETARFFQNYSLNINNAAGQLTYSFEIVEEDPEMSGPENSDPHDQNTGAIAGGAVAAVLVVVVVAAAILLFKRKGAPCKPKDDQCANTSMKAFKGRDASGAPYKQKEVQYFNTIMNTAYENDESGESPKTQAPEKAHYEETQTLENPYYEETQAPESRHYEEAQALEIPHYEELQAPESQHYEELQAPESPHYEEIDLQTDVPDKPVDSTNQIPKIQHAEVEYQNAV